MQEKREKYDWKIRSNLLLFKKPMSLADGSFDEKIEAAW